MAAQDTPKAVQILCSVGTNGVRLDIEALKGVLSEKSLKNVPVAIVSIAGAFRKGKSYLLNFFLHYMRQKRWKYESWLDNLLPEKENGFHWRGGKNADTKGIFLWSKPFRVETNEGEIAVLLMDTQGLFEHGVKCDVDAKILELSMSLSSVQIMNVSKRIQAVDLEYFRYYVDYTSGLRGKKDLRCEQLVFLVRDWTDPDGYDYGANGGDMYLKQQLDRSDSASDTKKYIKQLREVFSELKCFLLPQPLEGRIRDFTGGFEELSEEFKENVQSLSSMILHPESLLPKGIDREVRTARALLTNVQIHAAMLCSDKLLRASSMTGAAIISSCFDSYSLALDWYNKTMYDTITSDAVTSIKELQNFHKEQKANAVARYKNKCPYADSSQSKEYEIRTSNAIEMIYYPKYKGLLEQELTKKAVEGLLASIQRKKSMRSKELRIDNTLPAPVQKAADLFKRNMETFIDKNPSFIVKTARAEMNKKLQSTEELNCVSPNVLEKEYAVQKKQVLDSFLGKKSQIADLEKEIARLYGILSERNKELMKYVLANKQHILQQCVNAFRKAIEKCPQDVAQTPKTFKMLVQRVIKEQAEKVKEAALNEGSSEEAADQIKDEAQKEMEDAAEESESFFKKHPNVVIGVEIALVVCAALPLGGVPLALGGVVVVGSIIGAKKLAKRLSKKKLDD